MAAVLLGIVKTCAVCSERHFHLTAVNVLGENPLKDPRPAESVDGQSSRAGHCRRPGNLTASRRRSRD